MFRRNGDAFGMPCAPAHYTVRTRPCPTELETATMRKSVKFEIALIVTGGPGALSGE